MIPVCDSFNTNFPYFVLWWGTALPLSSHPKINKVWFYSEANREGWWLSLTAMNQIYWTFTVMKKCIVKHWHQTQCSAVRINADKGEKNVKNHKEILMWWHHFSKSHEDPVCTSRLILRTYSVHDLHDDLCADLPSASYQLYADKCYLLLFTPHCAGIWIFAIYFWCRADVSCEVENGSKCWKSKLMFFLFFFFKCI